MHIEITLSTPVGRKLNGAAEEILAILRAAHVDYRIDDRNFGGIAYIYANVPVALIPRVRECTTVLTVRAQ